MSLPRMACDLTAGAIDLPGGRVFATRSWVVEHCVGPLGVGTLVAKPFRPCTALADLSPDEASELGPLLRLTSGVVQALTAADQVYACLWSHAHWVPGHVHFVLQPAWAAQRARYAGPGPSIQMEMFRAGEPPDRAAVEAFCDRARDELARRLR